MNSKERVSAVLEGRMPDRVPIGEFAIDFDTVEKIIGHETYFRAKAKSQIAFWEGRHDEVAESYLKDHIELHEKLDFDIVTFPWATWNIPDPTDEPAPRKVDENTWEDRYGRVYKYSENTQDITCVKDPVMEATVFAPEDFQDEPVQLVINDSSRKIIDSVIERFKDEKYICSPHGGEIGIVFLGGMTRGCMEIIINPDAVRAATEFKVRQQNLHDEVSIHPDSDAIIWGIDFAHNGGTFVSPDMFKEFFLDANKARIRNVREKFGKRVLKHCCGNVSAILDLFLDIGYDAYQSIQPTAGMDICEVKRTHGDKITLWGGVAVENIISGTAEDVRKDVQRAMKCAKPDGRFILGTSHSVAVGSKYDNFMAMLDEHHKLCDY
ncbi:uroporphyrinogen decarboxylase family protein [Candidatus Hydrogenedentota bacterium]